MKPSRPTSDAADLGEPAADVPAQRNEGRARRPLTPKAREEFLAGLAQGLTVRLAAEGAGRAHPRRFYELRADDDAFAQEWSEALEQGTQLLEDELRRRAVEGWEETLREYREGALVRETVTRRYSPALLIFMLKARRPELYRDNAIVKVTGHDGGPVQVEGYAPPTLADVVRLAGELGVLDELGYRQDAVDGEAVEEQPLELESGG